LAGTQKQKLDFPQDLESKTSFGVF
jgi:hypothetical protein